MLYWRVLVIRTWLPSIWYPLGAVLPGHRSTLCCLQYIRSSRRSTSSTIRTLTRRAASLHSTISMPHTMDSLAVVPTHANSPTILSHSHPLLMISLS
ncbi:hypothetical protein EDD16DRAFT_1585264 [Pisolithus croceorrhizus]|nr:hypothetical protein EDD16DRAFT_1585264 [Pisolithus croceorrhizus]